MPRGWSLQRQLVVVMMLLVAAVSLVVGVRNGPEQGEWGFRGGHGDHPQVG